MRLSSPTEARAVARYVRVSPYKARQITAGLRGKSVTAAQRELSFTRKAAARPVLKTLDSAVANAENNKDLDADDLFILEIKVDEGPTLKRYQPRAMGRASRIRKRTCHITVTVGHPPLESTDTAPVPGDRDSTADTAPAQNPAQNEEN